MADKQQALVNAISEGVAAKQMPEFAKLADELAKLGVTVNSCLARLSLLENSVASGAAGAKRTVRPGGAKPAAGKKPAAKKGASDESKVTNALLYFRYAMSNNLDEYQEIYGTEENCAEADKDQTVAKRDKDKDPNGYWSAVGAALWKTVLTDEQKAEIKSTYGSWKEQSTRDATEEQLDEEPAQ